MTSAYDMECFSRILLTLCVVHAGPSAVRRWHGCRMIGLLPIRCWTVWGCQRHAGHLAAVGPLTVGAVLIVTEMMIEWKAAFVMWCLWIRWYCASIQEIYTAGRCMNCHLLIKEIDELIIFKRRLINGLSLEMVLNKLRNQNQVLSSLFSFVCLEFVTICFIFPKNSVVTIISIEKKNQVVREKWSFN